MLDRDFDYTVPPAGQQFVNRELSIQIGLNGFSFLVMEDTSDPFGELQTRIAHTAFHAAADMEEVLQAEPVLQGRFGRVFIACSTDHVLLVPQALFEPERAEQYLAAANMFLPEMTTLSNNLLSPQAAAVWQVEGPLAAGLLRLYPGALFYHPLQLELDAALPHTVQILLDGALAHIVVRNEGLHAAETFRVPTAEDLLYSLQKLVPQQGLSYRKLILRGEHVSGFRDFFRPYFSEVETQDVSFYMHQKIRELCV